MESLDVARAWLEANPSMDAVHGVDELMESYKYVVPKLGLGDWRPGAGSSEQYSVYSLARDTQVGLLQ